MPSDSISISSSLTGQSIIVTGSSNNASQQAPSLLLQNIEKISNTNDSLQLPVENQNIAMEMDDSVITQIGPKTTHEQEEQPPISEEELEEFFSQEGWQLAAHEMKEFLTPEDQLILADLTKEDTSSSKTSPNTAVEHSQKTPVDTSKTAHFKLICQKLNKRILFFFSNAQQPDSKRLSREQLAQKEGISSDQLMRLLKVNGSLTEIGQELVERIHGKRFNPITRETLAAWQANQQLPNDKRLSRADFAQQHAISANQFYKLVYKDGSLKAPSTVILQRTADQNFNPITHKTFSAWQANQKLAADKRLSRADFAQQHGISVGRFLTLVSQDGQLSPRAQEIKKRSQGQQYHDVKKETLRLWLANQMLPPKKRLSRSQFALKHHITIEKFCTFIQSNGKLSLRGRETMGWVTSPTNRMTEEILHAWQMNQRQSESHRLSCQQFIETHQLSLSSFNQYVDEKGELTEDGKKLAQSGIYGSHSHIASTLLAWQTNLDLPTDQRLSREQFAEREQIPIKQLSEYVCIDGSFKKRANETLQKTNGKAFDPVTKEVLLDWQKNQMQPNAQRLSREQFHQKWNISNRDLSLYANEKGNLTEAGERRVHQNIDLNAKDKALLAWQANLRLPEEQRLSRENFAQKWLLPAEQLPSQSAADTPTSSHFVKLGERLLQATHHRKETPYKPITKEILLSWQAHLKLPKDQRMLAIDFAKKEQISTAGFSKYIRADGILRPEGINLLERVEGKKNIPIRQEILLAWQANQKQPESLRLSREQFAQEKEISLERFYAMVKKDGSFSEEGEIILAHSAEIKFKPITAEVLFAWQNNLLLPKEKRLSRSEFVQTHHISGASLDHHISREGYLKSRGEQLMQRLHGHTFQNITKETLRAWQENQQLPPNKRLSIPAFAEAHKISIENLRRRITKDGSLTAQAQNTLNHAPVPKSKPMTKEILQAWQANQKLVGNKHLSHEQFAEMHDVSVANLRKYISSIGNFTKRALQRFYNKKD